MKRVLLVSLGLIAMASYAGCLPDDGSTTGTGGSPGTGGNPQGAGGTPQGTGGNPQGTGGTTGDGGSGVGGDGTGGTAGSTATGGTGGQGATGGGTGGQGATGGGTGGNPTAGAGGTPRGGAGGGGSSGAGGTPRGGAGGGGATGTGGAGGTPRGGTTGTGGGGSTGTGGAPGLPTIPELFPVTSTTIGSLDGRLMVMPCNDDNATGTDCGGSGGYYSTAGAGSPTRIQCSGGSFTANQVFNVGGETGRRYQVVMHIYGVSEPKNYGTGVTRDAGTGRPAATPTGAGAVPATWATAAGGHSYPVSDYNTNEIRVCSTRACATGDETNVYYLNADTSEGHWTYVMNYEKTITVVGGGSIRVRNYDRNCRQIKNCGPAGVAANQCANEANAKIINVSAAMPTPTNAAAASGGLLQPNLDPARPTGSSGQWVLIDMVRVTSVQ